MENFTERMLERTQRRQKLLVSASLEVQPQDLVASPGLSTSPPKQDSPTPPKPKSPTPPRRTSGIRRHRFAELASRVDTWLEEDKCDIKPKSNENISTVTKTAMSTNHVSQKVANKSKIMSYVNPTNIEENHMTNINNSTLTQQSKPQLFGKLKQFHQSQQLPHNIPQPQWQSSNLDEFTLTVAQRRALFEKNIAGQQQIKKQPSTTIVTISLTKTTATPAIDTTLTTVVEEDLSEPTEYVTTTPPRSIPCSKTTPPSRRGTRPRENLFTATATHMNTSPKQRQAWTPPCIKNVLLKKNLIVEMDEEQRQMSERESTGTNLATSSPINDTPITSADHIAKSVGRVRFMPPSPSGLYPDLSLIENNDDDNKETIATSCKKRRNSSNALNSSTASSESIYEDADNSEMLGAKRSRCEPKSVDTTQQDTMITVIEKEHSVAVTSTTKTNTPGSNHSLSMLSDQATSSSLSQTCASFTYYCPDNDSMLPSNFINLIDEKPCKKEIIEPVLVHTVSTYRKQQQQLRSGGTPKQQNMIYHEKNNKEGVISHSALLRHRLEQLDDEDDDDDEDEEELQELEAVAERARYLERKVVPEQDRIIEQATQALNICDVYRQKNGLRPVTSNKFSPEHVHAERLLLIAGLRRLDAVREAQRLRVECTLLPGERSKKIYGNGRTLVIESLRVPILSAMVSGGNKGTDNLTRWSGGYRYFVCAIRAAATSHRPPVTSATRPVDAVEESVLRFSVDSTTVRDDGSSSGYIEFITKKQIKSSGSRKCPMPTEAEGAPIMIHNLDGRWKITIELYGISPTTVTGEHESHYSSGNNKEHDSHENIKSVLDKLWSTVTTSKESKKHATTVSTACIESPGGPMAVRNTVFRQLGYFVFSNGQVNRQQFTLNKVHQSGSVSNTSKVTAEETVRVCMRLLKEGEQYIYDNDEGTKFGNNQYAGGKIAIELRKPLTLPSECKQTEGFLTLFDDHELRTTPALEHGQKWQRHYNIGGNTHGGTTSWRRLWFRADVIDDPKQETSDNSYDEAQKQQGNNIGRQKTIVLRYWLYPEHAEQQREPIGAIDLGRCVPRSPPVVEVTSDQRPIQKPVPAAPALPDLCARPNTLRLFLYCGSVRNAVDDPLLLSADTADERREWCETINAAVLAIGEHRDWFKMTEATRLKQKQQEKEMDQKQRLINEQLHTGAWPVSGSNSKSYGKKKKLHK